MSPQHKAISPPWEDDIKDAAARRREARWDLLRWQWKHSSIEKLHHCRLHTTSGSALLRVAGGTAYWDGLQTCASVWACPVCSAIIRTRRAVRIEASARTWIETGPVDNDDSASDGERWLAFLTLTVRHHKRDGLAGLYQGMAAAWKSLRESWWWQKLGWWGMWRSVEVTYGENGWHPHIHLLLFGQGAQRDLEALGRELSERWQAAVLKAGMEATSVRRGAVLQAVNVESGVNGAGGYLSKVLDGEGRGREIGSELARSDSKRGRAGRFSPMQLLEAAADGEAWAVGCWREYEQATFGRRAIESSRQLMKRLGLEDQDDEDLVAEDQDGEAVLALAGPDYRAIAWAGWVPRVMEQAERGDGPATVELVEALLRLLRGGGS